MRVSYYPYRATGSHKAYTNAKCQVTDFEDIWNSQLNLPNPQKENGAIYALDIDTLYSIDYIRENNIKGNGLILLDIDNLTTDQRDLIFQNIDNINQLLQGWIYTAIKSSGGLHIIMMSKPMTDQEYHEEYRIALTSFAYATLTTTNIDLREIHGALDLHNSQLKQQMYLHQTDNIYWNHESQPIDPTEDTKLNLYKLYPTVFKDKLTITIDNKVIACSATNNYKRKFYANQLSGYCTEIKNLDQQSIDKVGYNERWRLWDSLVVLFGIDEAKAQWERCSKILINKKHNIETEPYKKSKWMKTVDLNFDSKVLNKLGYILDPSFYKVINQDKVDQLIASIQKEDFFW